MTLGETVVAMTISSMMLASVLSVLFASVKLVNTAPPDTNPHTFGALASSLAQLEGSLAAPLLCENPAGVNSRSDCIKVVAGPVAPQRHDGHPVCWVVVSGADRRLECWELLEQGDLVAHRYAPAIPPAPPDPLSCAEVKDCLTIPGWETIIEETLPKAYGLAALEWDTSSSPVTLTGCAAIRPDQLTLTEPDEVEFCDGEQGLYLPDGRERPGTKGFLMPMLRVLS